MCDPAFRRAQQIKIKSEATWVAFLELDGLINKSKLAEQYFNKSQAWLSQKINGTVSHGARVDLHTLTKVSRESWMNMFIAALVWLKGGGAF